MTPFHIRKRLKSLLGDGPTATDDRCSITFVLPDGTERAVKCEKHYSILMAADANGITISTGKRAGGSCPDGACDLCRVEVLNDAGLSPMKAEEAAMMDNHTAGLPHEGRDRAPAPARSSSTRLGCHAKVIGSGAKIQIAELFDPNSIRGSMDGT